MNKKKTVNLDKAFSFIEGNSLLVRLSIVNNLSDFIKQVIYDEEFLNAKDIILSDPKTNIPLVLKRVDKLLKIKSSKKHLHPFDIQIASYILLIAETGVGHVQDLLKKIRDKKLSNLCWANIIGNNVGSATFPTTGTLFSNFTIKAYDKMQDEKEEKMELSILDERKKSIDIENIFSEGLWQS